MIKITIPQNNLEERKYILDIVFDEFLGLKYKVEVRSEKRESGWEIELENGSKVIFEDHFFNKYPKELEYLKLENIPCTINYEHKESNQFIVENDIPVIYGNSKLEIKDQKLKTITCGIDIFASSFFMLTRWEEYLNKARDKHDRFPATESLAYKNGFLDRPIVNEYVDMLKNMLLHLGSNQKIKERNYELYVTHDVDNIKKFINFKDGIKEIVGDIVKRKDIKKAFKNFIQKIKVHLKLEKDPYDTFDDLITISEKYGVKSYFFFMAQGRTKYDNMYQSDDEFVLDLIKRIKNKDHYIGIHPTYNAYNNYEQLKKEKEELENNFNIPITFGREHYLRFEVPTTWQIWEDNKMSWDSTCGYADKEGFRCGVCYEYSVFNILTRKKLSLVEKPLIIMEDTFVTYQSNIEPIEVENKIITIIERVKRYNGIFVVLWHNSSFNTISSKKYEYIYEKILGKR
ncbi:polysaccharide deacetylase family protein [Aliarcobacter butzleri]|uniref:polysaccharide deacetylase family protein n=1 Tax=Aliarcobacter butzleri TaxID=28197 RepID=UPI00125FCE9E|nr:polysaccharide deacetylase family protein [Aliarcobacter butzleri]MCT7560533.1 polysaccharide deacetylase family protein [Aliarcobacter butzleri]MCT7628538.1 polysaccharide deacetylase family protein [Aliarcobacter butzleri]